MNSQHVVVGLTRSRMTKAILSLLFIHWQYLPLGTQINASTHALIVPYDTWSDEAVHCHVITFPSL
jgi:hypothetical protein